MTAEQHVPLAEGLEHTRAEWEKATAAVLRKTRRLAEDAPDSDVWGILSTTTLDGLSISPLGTPNLVADVADIGEPGQAPYIRGAGLKDDEIDGWDVRVWLADPTTSAEDVSTELENGVNSLWLSLDPASYAAVLEPVFLDLAPVVLDHPADPLGAARAFLTVADDKAQPLHRDTNLGVDPAGNRWRGIGNPDVNQIVEAAELGRKHGIRGLLVDATVAHDKGASEVQELAWSMMAAVTYLRVLESAGWTLDDAARQIEFRYAATDNQFLTIAKFRAARALWNRVGELSGVGEAARAQRQHAVTSRPMMARYDAYTNMLRTTVAAFAAGVGGADAVTVLPFDEPLGLPTPFSRRIARNTSSLLIHESHVAKVIDPAGGAHAVEKLTDDLSFSSWAFFGELDGMDQLEGVDDLDAAIAHLDVVVEATRADRAAAIAKRSLPITGVSEFPNLAEELPQREPNPATPPVYRYAEEFEALRDEPAQNPVFLATMGTIAAHTARTTFVTNLFAAGGVHVSAAGASTGVDDVIERYREAGTPPVVCLAGHDADYTEWGSELVTALREAGAGHVIVAGRADLGQDASAAAGLDALAFLRSTREELA